MGSGTTRDGDRSTTCDSCRRPITGEPVRTPTRTLCRDCGDGFLGLAAGALAGQGSAAQAIATEGWFRRLRRRGRPSR